MVPLTFCTLHCGIKVIKYVNIHYFVTRVCTVYYVNSVYIQQFRSRQSQTSIFSPDRRSLPGVPPALPFAGDPSFPRPLPTFLTPDLPLDTPLTP